MLTRQGSFWKAGDIDERFVDEHTLTTSISRIRSKIESDGGAPYIKTVYGMGVSMDRRRGKMKVKNLSVKSGCLARVALGLVSLHVRDYHSPCFCDKTDCGAADGQGTAVVRLCGGFLY